MARFVLLSSLALKSFFGSAIRAPLGKVNLTEFLSASPMQTIPSLDQTGTPAGLLGFFHFTSSTTEGDARLIEARSRASVSPRQSRSSLMIESISCEAFAHLRDHAISADSHSAHMEASMLGALKAALTSA